MREDVAALVFGPGLPPGGATGTLSVSSLGIEVTAAGSSQRVDTSEVALREVGFGKPGIEFAWNDGKEPWAAHVLDPVIAKRLLTLPMLAAITQASAIKRAQRRNNVGRKIGWSLIGLFVGLPGILLALLLMNAGRFADWFAGSVSIEQETRWGAEAFASMSGKLVLKDSGPAYDAVQALTARLSQGSKFTYRVHIAEDKSLNAFALPGGFIVIHTGLIAATERPEELAGVLAHEIQHVEQRHAVKGMIKEMGLRGLWTMISGDLGSTIAGQAAVELTSLKFSRSDESDADRGGFDALIAADIDPVGMITFFQSMSQSKGQLTGQPGNASGQAREPPALFSTHPPSADRERALQQRLEQLQHRDFPALSFGAWPPQM